MRKDSDFIPGVAVFASGVVWGLFWYPIRELNYSGVSAAWTLLIVFGIAGLGYAGAFIHQRSKTGKIPWSVLFTGVIIGGSIVIYGVAIVLTDVVKAILLFYLAPVWTTVLGRLMLGEPVTSFRIASVVTGVIGLLVVLGVFDDIPSQLQTGDAISILGGILYAYATVRIRKEPEVPVWQQVGAFFIGAGIVSLALILAPIPGFETAPTIDSVVNSTFWLAVVIIVYLPTIYLLMWGSQILSPTRVLLLLMTDVFCGVISAALLSGEPIGTSQIIGTGLIMSATVIDALGYPQNGPTKRFQS